MTEPDPAEKAPGDFDDTQHNEPPQTLLSHLIELRGRLLRMVVAVLLGFIALAPFAPELYTVVSSPLMRNLPEGSTMIATQVASPFLAPLKLAFYAALFLTMPYLLYQVWAFVAPGLYQKEKRLAVPLLMSSVILFYSGALFAYFVVFPLLFQFFPAMLPEGTAMMTDINQYLNFMLPLLLAFGLAFEVPVAIMILVWTGFVKPAALRKNRAYVFLGAFVIGMLLTPPDFISQTLLALPMYVLYEVGILMASRFVAPSRSADSESATGET